MRHSCPVLSYDPQCKPVFGASDMRDASEVELSCVCFSLTSARRRWRHSTCGSHSLVCCALWRLTSSQTSYARRIPSCGQRWGSNNSLLAWGVIWSGDYLWRPVTKC